MFAVNHRHTYTYPRIDTDKEGQFPFYQPYYLLIDMQLGGSWVGAVDPKELPVEMWVDWVKYYEKRWMLFVGKRGAVQCWAAPRSV